MDHNTLDITKLDARPDTVDFRDLMYVPALDEVPVTLPLETFANAGVSVRAQGDEGACTGFGLATVVDYLQWKRTGDQPRGHSSARMLYETAKLYDEWEGRTYEGSSARGAMKGWHKHGVCAEEFWPYVAGERGDPDPAYLEDAAQRPLGAYFRVNHKNLVAMHSAISKVGALYATARVHPGWLELGDDGVIPRRAAIASYHAFAVVGYDQHGFWIQNSWGEDWGRGGFGLITYSDWLQNGTDAWAASFAVPVGRLQSSAMVSSMSAGAQQVLAYSFNEMRPHVITLANDGALKQGGTFATDTHTLRQIVREDLPRITENWSKRRVLLIAHGGLVKEKDALHRLARLRRSMLDQEVYPLLLAWNSDLESTWKNLVEDGLSQRRPEGILDDALDFMLDRIDDTLEPLVRSAGGRLLWDEMKENVGRATTLAQGGIRLLLDELDGLFAGDMGDEFELHLLGHSAGGNLLAPVVRYFTAEGTILDAPFRRAKGLGRTVDSMTLWGPAITIDEFERLVLPAIRENSVRRFTLFTLTDAAEQSDSIGGVYNKSLLYLVRNALETEDPRHPAALLGMETDVEHRLASLFDDEGHIDHIRCPNIHPEDPNGNGTVASLRASRSTTHGGFDNDEVTLRTTLGRILGGVSNLERGKAAVGLERAPATAARWRQAAKR